MTWIVLINLIEVIGWLALGCFSLHRLWLVALWLRHRERPVAPRAAFRALPSVTVQLPVYNERYVVERLLAAVAALDYPRDRLEIQVLDDSTDDTVELVARQVARLQAQGHRIVHRHRPHRAGFKAGALADGLAAARGEFIAIFDADFVPPADFLRRTIHYFTDPVIGMVQTRWGHLNRSDSLLTQAEAIMLDGHFLVEQIARSQGGYFFTFNGSAGLWRKAAIVDAGGWHADTLTEDLDLSYRAQLKGWRFAYLPDLVVPAELPVQMSGLKAQQHRWTKGSIQTALKLLPAIWRSDRPWGVKVESCFHLGNWLHYPLGVLIILLALPILALSHSAGGSTELLASKGGVGLAFFGMTLLFYGVGQHRAGVPWWRFLLQVPVFMAISIGVALNNTRAIWEAFSGIPSAFTRTPKYSGRRAGARPPGYRPDRSGTTWWWAEVALGCYLFLAVAYAASQALYASVPFLLPLSAGFLYAGFSSLQPGSDDRVTLSREATLVGGNLDDAVLARSGSAVSRVQ